MNIKYNGKVYKANRENDARLMITVGKVKVFAGFGEGNMNNGFKLVEEVQETAPVKDDSQI